MRYRSRMSKYDDLIQNREPPAKRKSKADGGIEHHFTEAAVMLAYVMHLFETDPSLRAAEIHPDGEHGKRFDIRGWLEAHGFHMAKPIGTTSYGGEYQCGERTLTVSLKPGQGDVVAFADDYSVVAECKGGVINTRHSGQLSRLRSGLYEVVGLLMTRDPEAERHIAVVPCTEMTTRLARAMIQRCHMASIEIALVSGDGSVTYVESEMPS